MKKILFSLIVIAALAGCSKSENQPASGNAIMIGASAPVSASPTNSSRAPYLGIPSGSTQPLSAYVIGVPSLTDLTTRITNAAGTISFTDASAPGEATQANVKGFTPVANYPDAVNPVYLLGYYPASGWTFAGSQATIALDGKTDVMVAPAVATYKSDATSQPTQYKNLAFEHKLTLLNFSIKADNTTAASMWGNITDIKINYVPNIINVNPAGTATFQGAIKGYNLYTLSGTTYSDQVFPTLPTPIPTTATPAAYSLVGPVATNIGDISVSEAYYVRIYTSNTLSFYEVPITLSFDTPQSQTSTQGQSFNVTLNFRVAEIEAIATVEDWNGAGTGSATM